jgi:hypothetical protein
VHAEQRRVLLDPGIQQTVVFRWQPPSADFRGYLAVVSAQPDVEPVSTGLDVSSSPLRYPRYGYVSVFPARPPSESSALIATLAERYLLNMFQFYDWFYRPEELVARAADGAPASDWVDLFGRTQVLSTITDTIAAVHAENGLALAYAAIYAAREGFERRSGISPALGLFEQPSATSQAAIAQRAGVAARRGSRSGRAATRMLPAAPNAGCKARGDPNRARDRAAASPDELEAAHMIDGERGHVPAKIRRRFWRARRSGSAPSR